MFCHALQGISLACFPCGNGQQPGTMQFGIPWAGHMPISCKNPRRIPRRTTLIWSKNMPVLCQEYMLFFCLPLSSQPRLNLLTTPPRPLRAHAPRAGGEVDYSMANRKIAYILGRGWAYMSDMSSTSGYMGAKYVQEFGPRFFDMSSAGGYMGEKYVQ